MTFGIQAFGLVHEFWQGHCANQPMWFIQLLGEKPNKAGYYQRPGPYLNEELALAAIVRWYDPTNFFA